MASDEHDSESAATASHEPVSHETPGHEMPGHEPVNWHELLRGLRHELRTPINHIVGYSELLLEVAEERSHAALLADLEKIRAAGAELGALVNESLDAARLQTTLPDTVALSRDLRTPLNTIVGYSELLEEEAEEGGYADLLPDLHRIRTAARHLLGQVHVLLDLAEDLAIGVLTTTADPVDRSVATPTAPPSAPVAALPSLSRSAPPRQEHPGTSTARLLVVDDDEANRDMLSRRL